ncbi:MAG: Leu/Ile/Val/Thr-binding protein [Herbaspirillum frisingense]|uniref:Leu/Ile/Val/Thr-binding protein n=1 Tax=Herbaspirillum frisingense TaxID=92645 RepID=A0A7V8FZ69_9BURK|nr:MAG: Leu/Ile/Val/Thr-binding protein [Herbaspirillum frisingense]
MGWGVRSRRFLRWLAGPVCLASLALPAPGASAENGISATEVLLGGSAPLSGPSGEVGSQFLAGAQAYFSRLNARGGIHGRKLRLISMDDGYDPARTLANTRQLIERDKVFALFGYVGTPTVTAALPLINGARIPLFAPMSGAASLREPFNRLIFNIRASYASETLYLLRQLRGNGRSKVAVFYQNDEFGQSTLDTLRDRVGTYGLSLVGAVGIPRNSDVVSRQADALLRMKPDVVILVVSYRAAAALILQMRRAGYLGGFSNYSFVGSRSLANRLKDEGAGIEITQVVPFPGKARLPIVYEYQKATSQMPSAGDSFSGLEGYIAARALAEGVRRAGRNLTREGLIRALESITPDSYDGGGFVLQFGPSSHNGSDYVDLTAIGTGGRFIN